MYNSLKKYFKCMNDSSTNALTEKINIILLGDNSVGKSRVIQKYCHNSFTESSHATIGVDFSIKDITHKNKKYRIRLWDTAGQQCYKSLISQYLKDTLCAFVLFDVTKKTTFEDIENWLKLYNQYKTGDAFTLLIGNKIDLKRDRQVSQKQAKNKATELGMHYFQISAKTGQNIETLFQIILDILCENSIDPSRLLFPQLTEPQNIEQDESENQQIQQAMKQFLKSQEQSLMLSSVLVEIYKAANKMNKIYQTPLLQQYFKTKNHQYILDSVSNGKSLREQECNQVLLCSIQTIQQLGTRIKMTQKKSHQKLQSYDHKILKIKDIIQDFCNKNDLKRTLYQYANQSARSFFRKQSKDAIDQVQLCFNKFVQKVVQIIEKQKASCEEVIHNINYQKQAKYYMDKKKNEQSQKIYKFEAQNKLKSKDQQIKRLSQQLQKIQLYLKHQQDFVQKLQNDLDEKSNQIQRLKIQNKKSSMEFNNKMKQQKNKNNDQIKNYQREIQWVQYKLQNSIQQIRNLQRRLNESKSSHENSSNALSIAQNQISKLKQKLQDKQKQLTKTKNQLQTVQQQRKRYQQQTRKIERQKDQLLNVITKQQNSIIDLKNKLKSSEKEINYLKEQNKKQESNSRTYIKSLQKQLAQKRSLFKDIQKQLHQNKSFISQVVRVFSQKVNKKVEPEHLIDQINSYQPPVGMKLIYSGVLHGMDAQRSNIIGQIQKFMGKNIKKTQMLARYPDTKAIIHQLPKQNKNFAFIMFYKTKNNRVFGSFSEGMEKRTFFFSFNWSPNPQSEQQIKVDFYFAKDQYSKLLPVQIFQYRYLQYGNGELRIKCIDMSTISADSDVVGQSYYDFNWKEIMNEKNEQKVDLVEVELHKVEFQPVNQQQKRQQEKFAEFTGPSIKKIKQQNEDTNRLLQKIRRLENDKQQLMIDLKNKQWQYSGNKIKQNQVQKYMNEIAQKQELIKSLKAQNQKSSIELNKKIKLEKDKFQQMKKQYDSKIQQLHLNVQIANQKIHRMSIQLQKSKKSSENILPNKQNAQLKLKLQEKQRFLERMKEQLDNKKNQIQKLKQELIEANKKQTPHQNLIQQKQFILKQNNPSLILLQSKDQTIVILQKQIKQSYSKIQQLQKQLAETKNIKVVNQQLQQKVDQLNMENKVFQKKMFKYLSKIDQLENQIVAIKKNQKM